MQLSLVFTTLLSCIAIAAAYPTPLGVKLSSVAERDTLGSNLVGYLDTRSPNDVSQPSMPSSPASDVDYLNTRSPGDDTSHPSDTSNTSNSSNGNGDQSDGDEDIKA